MQNDTIAALATPVAMGALGVIRVSGPQAVTLSTALFQGRVPLSQAKPRTQYYGRLIHPVTQALLDDVLATVFIAPHSYTGENLVEFSCHGNPYLLREILNCLYTSGARPAQPGEFTQRAFINGKLDLTQAEAVQDLIMAHSADARASALARLSGQLSHRVFEIRDTVLNLLALAEAAVDHSDLEETFLNGGLFLKRIADAQSAIDSLLSTARAGRMASHGVKAVLAGKPNAGKSSIMNRLLREDRVIVSEIAGTTRDTIEHEVMLGGVLYRLLDTAGLRESEDRLEKAGIDRTHSALNDADLVLLVLDASDPSPIEPGILQRLQGLTVLPVWNKCDTTSSVPDHALLTGFLQPVEVSAINGSGFDTLEASMARVYTDCQIDPARDVLITNARQEQCLSRCREGLERAAEEVRQGLSEEFAARSIRMALNALQELTGRTTDDQLLDKIFSQFCIGK